MYIFAGSIEFLHHITNTHNNITTLLLSEISVVSYIPSYILNKNKEIFYKYSLKILVASQYNFNSHGSSICVHSMYVKLNELVLYTAIVNS